MKSFQKPETRRNSVALVWNQFGPYHMDRCGALARALGPSFEVVGIEISSSSDTYAWDATGKPDGWTKFTLFPNNKAESIGWKPRFYSLIRILHNKYAVFLTGYHLKENFLLSIALKLWGIKVFVMTESKFDDKDRKIISEIFKSIACLGYSGALVGGKRHEEYLRFLGFRDRPVVFGYDTVNLERIRSLGLYPPAPEGLAFEDRHFIFVGRFVEKKNIEILLYAYARYREIAGGNARRLAMVGGGVEQPNIIALSRKLHIDKFLDFHGFLQEAEVAEVLSTGIALVLPSSEEQWGLVVNEATAFNLPIIVSDKCGCRDSLVRQAVNGYVVESDNIEGLAHSMHSLSDDVCHWRRMVKESSKIAPIGDVKFFANGAMALLDQRA